MKPNDGLAFASMSAVRAKDKEAWLDLFEADALVEDPVGGHPYLDPTGKGHSGREAIGRFYDTFSAAQSSMDFEVHHHVACGTEEAAFVTMRMKMMDGTARAQKMINIYRLSPQGRIASLRSFWR